MTWLLNLYPREWRRRYGSEYRQLVASKPRSLQLFFDLLAGAVDARVNPKAFARQLDAAGASDRGGGNMATRMKGCCSTATVNRKDRLLDAALTVGAAIGVVAIIAIGGDPNGETIGLTMFPGVLAIGTLSRYSRGHSIPARLMLIGGPFLILFLIGVLTVLARSA